MLEWLADADVDIMALQEVRATAEQLAASLPGWRIIGDEALAKGRAGVAIASLEDPVSVRRILEGPKRLDASGRWLEADFVIDGEELTVVSAYVPSGEADTPKQIQKWDFLNAMEKRMRQLRTLPLAVVMGDLNVGHRELDIRNWKGNVKKAGFLPRERAYFDRLFGATGTIVTGVDGSRGRGQGWVDVGRRFHGEVDGPYTWWSMMGRAFDNDAGWRIDYQVATPDLAERVSDYLIARAPSWDTRWSDHAPVIADYTIGL
jgi:exodeoxyribonuclease-3